MHEDFTSIVQKNYIVEEKYVHFFGVRHNGEYYNHLKLINYLCKEVIVHIYESENEIHVFEKGSMSFICIIPYKPKASIQQSTIYNPKGGV